MAESLTGIKRVFEVALASVAARPQGVRGPLRGKDFMLDDMTLAQTATNTEPGGVSSMQNRFFRSIGRFFEGTGSAISTPSGDARGHVNVPIDTMFDVSAGTRWVGR